MWANPIPHLLPTYTGREFYCRANLYMVQAINWFAVVELGRTNPGLIFHSACRAINSRMSSGSLLSLPQLPPFALRGYWLCGWCEFCCAEALAAMYSSQRAGCARRRCTGAPADDILTSGEYIISPDDTQSDRCGEHRNIAEKQASASIDVLSRACVGEITCVTANKVQYQQRDAASSYVVLYLYIFFLKEN